ncbi:MAG: alpha/beta fold hydrolase [Alphaproteobacteria bacterium]|nr:alpha/beta fold hydrolase [Alphaproteobacteria bacterium]
MTVQDSRETLVLVPGLLCDEALWEHQIRHLGRIADIRVADTLSPDSLDGMVDGILATAPPQFSLAGLSMGGYIAMELLRQAPERVRRLALLDTSARPDTPEQREGRAAMLAASHTGEFKGITRRLLGQFIHPGRMQDTALAEAIMAMTGRVGPDNFRRQQLALLPARAVDRRPALAEIRCPTLVLCGREDVLTTLAMHEEIAGLIPGARLAVVEECGHLSTMERPHAVTALLRDWLLYDRP